MSATDRAGPTGTLVGHNDGILAEATGTEEEIVFVDLDRLMASRATLGRSLRRPDLYRRPVANDA